jgi:acetolactate synthase-1/3 small subunit
MTGSEGKIKGFLELLQPLGVQELVRSGRIAVSRGMKSIN